MRRNKKAKRKIQMRAVGMDLKIVLNNFSINLKIYKRACFSFDKLFLVFLFCYRYLNFFILSLDFNRNATCYGWRYKTVIS